MIITSCIIWNLLRHIGHTSMGRRFLHWLKNTNRETDGTSSAKANTS